MVVVFSFFLAMMIYFGLCPHNGAVILAAITAPYLTIIASLVPAYIEISGTRRPKGVARGWRGI